MQVINGTEYVYLDEPYWDSVKKRGSHKRTYIGKNIDGIFIPNKNFKLKQQLEEQQANLKPGPVISENCQRLFFGATYLLDGIADKIGIIADLKVIFARYYKEILSVAYYLVLEKDSRCIGFVNGVLHISTLL